MYRLLYVLSLCFIGTLAFGPTLPELQRARTKVPRSQYKGPGSDGLAKALNLHLNSSEPNIKPCEEWTPHELQVFMSIVHDARSPELQSIYEVTNDRRKLIRNSTVAYQMHWNELNAIASTHPHLVHPLRDTHCREAVMWWIHHLSEETRTEFREVLNLTVPTMPSAPRQPCDGTTKPEQHLCVHLEQPNSCDWCHSTQAKHDNGTAGTSPPNALNFTNGPDDGNPHGWDRKRRCDQDQLPRCQLCEGVGGHAWSDKNEDIDLVDCEVVSTPQEVGCKDDSGSPASCLNTTVHWPLYPKQFTISEVNGRPGYSDTLIGWKTDPFCFSFFPQNDSIPPLCYRSQDATGKWYDNDKEATRSDYNIKLTGLFHPFPNITASIMQVDWQMWIINHLWVVDQCVCANPSGNHCTKPPCYSYIWHWDTFKTAQYLGRENIGVEWIQNAGVGKNAKTWELDHFIMWSHHAWTDPKSGKIVRMWKSFNGLQNYDPEAWSMTVDPSVFDSPPAKCKKGGAKVRIHCSDDGNYDGKTVEGMEHITALQQIAANAGDVVTHDKLQAQYDEAMLKIMK